MSTTGCLRTGCLGCAGLFAVVLLIGVAIGITGFVMGPPEPRFENRELAHEVPGVLDPDSARDTPGAETDRPRTLGLGSLDSPPPPGRVILEVGMTDFEVVPGPVGSQIRIDADYDTASFQLDESLEIAADGSWTFRLKMGRQGTWLRHMFGNESKAPRLRLVLPRGAPMSIEGKFAISEASFELGGLSLVDGTFDLGIGEYDFSFEEPTPEPMRRFEIQAFIGELGVTRLGNASPRTVSLTHKIGEVGLDLEGAWRADADVSLRCGIGECTIQLPGAAHVNLADSGIGIGELDVEALERRREPPAGSPTIELSVSGRIGEVRLDR